MTDEQLAEMDRVKDYAWPFCPKGDEIGDLIAEVRRLRELERACRDYFWFDEEGNAYPPSYAFGPTETEYAALAAIGRLLEAEGE